MKQRRQALILITPEFGSAALRTTGMSPAWPVPRAGEPGGVPDHEWRERDHQEEKDGQREESDGCAKHVSGYFS
jgi:hypothetical protein